MVHEGPNDKKGGAMSNRHVRVVGTSTRGATARGGAKKGVKIRTLEDLRNLLKGKLEEPPDLNARARELHGTPLPADDDDAVQLVTERHHEGAVLNSQRERRKALMNGLHRVEHALANGGRVLCGCGEAIPLARLAATTGTAKRCINCQEGVEAGKRALGTARIFRGNERGPQFAIG